MAQRYTWELQQQILSGARESDKRGPDGAPKASISNAKVEA